LIAEGLNYVLAKYKKPTVAKVKSWQRKWPTVWIITILLLAAGESGFLTRACFVLGFIAQRRGWWSRRI